MVHIAKLAGAVLVIASLAVLVFVGQAYIGYGADVPSQGPERLSPADRVDSGSIVITSDGLLVRGLRNIRLVNLADTNSMDPVLDSEATAVEMVPVSTDELHAGDIVSYKSGSNTIIHRIVEIGDDGAWYAVTKGDNNPAADPDRVRFDQVKGVVVGIIY